MCAPSFLDGYGPVDVEAQRTPWSATPFWEAAFAGHHALLDALQRAVAAHGGVSRAFVKGYAYGYPDELFLLAMVWSFGDREVREARQVRLLTPPLPGEAIAAVVRTLQQEGAGPAWAALARSHRIDGLSPILGTGLLYFGGYGTGVPGHRPLVLDAAVLRALGHHDPDGGWPRTPGQCRRKDYERYLQQAEEWAACDAWKGTPETVEYALGDIGRRLAVDGGGGGKPAATA